MGQRPLILEDHDDVLRGQTAGWLWLWLWLWL